MPVTLRTVWFALILALSVTSLAGLPALAQDAPPHEGEGPRRQAPKAVAPAAAKPRVNAPAVSQKKAAPASTPAGKKKGPAVKNDGKPYLRSLDKNHDGRITRDEYVGGSKKRFAQADTNRDGVVSPQEAKAAKAKIQEKEAKRDAKRRAEGKPVKAKKKSDKPSKPHLSTFDKNKDGRVTQKEYLARRENKFAEMDLNHDGVISSEESRIAKKKLLERREDKKAKAKERRLRKIEEAKLKSQQAGVSSPGPELTAPATPPPAAPPVVKSTTPAPPGTPAPQDMPLTPIAPGVPAQPAPET
ncbi:MAG: hypothetical protein Q8O35_09665 [Humidesulfovibrio sp.]|jgi:Ca2+-binding EF-hand superfamily protein|uniref:EF-hand domain-containing protein n=1 Tax=Humidesulfovibrio sp. TaxID=2910988 RepID=UPI00273506EB|nr:hypothetical protein [Humidesulfovibrio sp.]MDP2848447.1 hypothetical protein [Humidesulfovibrio sp.]